MKSLLLSTITFALVGSLTLAHADVLCVKKTVPVRNSKVALGRIFSAKSGTCPKGAVAVLDTSTFTGPQGATGPAGPEGAAGTPGSPGAAGATGETGAAGENGSLRIYGNGSSGAMALVPGETTIESGGQQYSSVEIQGGATLVVPSGFIMRSSGPCNIAGTISVDVYAEGAVYRTGSITASTFYPSYVPGGAGLSTSAGGAGEFGTSANDLDGGFGAGAIGGGSNLLTNGTLAHLLRPGPLGGSGGGPGITGNFQGAGGGTITILCRGGVAISGNINANAANGSAGGGGGGGGGIVIIASPESITNTGTIAARGGNGGSSTSQIGAGGGGGGGLVHFIAPAVTAGTVEVSAGVGGNVGVAVTGSPRFAGSGGGSCAGFGGSGRDVAAGNGQGGGGAASLGVVLTTLTDPTSLF